jgi:hypothetical protein
LDGQVEKKTLIKGKKIKRTRTKLKKIKQQKLWLDDEIEDQSNLNKKANKKKPEIKKTVIKLEKNNTWQIII